MSGLGGPDAATSVSCPSAGFTGWYAGARLAMAWTRLYTRGLAPEQAAARRLEVAADLHDQILDATAGGLSGRRVTRLLLARTARGGFDDLSWRWDRRRPVGHVVARSSGPAVGLLAVALVTAGYGVALAVAAPVVGDVALDAAWAVHTTGAVLALAGLVLLVAGRPVAAAAVLSAGVLGMVAAFFWFPPAWVVGVLVIAFLGRSVLGPRALDL